MTRRFGVWAALCCAALGVTAAAGCKPAQPGDATKTSGPKAPDFSLKALDGTTVRLSDYRDKKVVLLDFWSTTCDPCLQEMPELAKIYERYKARGLEILAISADGPESLAQVTATAHDKGMVFPVLLDEETNVLVRYNPKREMPCTVLVDRGGSIVLKRSSYSPADESAKKSLVDAIEAALGTP